MVVNIISSSPPWKKAYRENVDAIKAQIRDLLSARPAVAIESKYTPLYDGSIPEDRFHLYLEPARNDLSVVMSRLTATESRIESSYLPFAEKIAKEDISDKEELATIREFTSFAEGVMGEEVHDLREHVRLAVENEQCAMCLGQIHDALAESLMDYEAAGLFVEYMATRFSA